MLSKMLVQEIQDLKDGGYALGEVIQHLKKRYGAKAPSIPTVRKYYDMDGVPDDLHAKTAKERAFDRPPFREAIVEILENNPKCYMSSVYDVLVEKYVDTGEFDALPGNEQTLRNFIHFLEESGAVPEEKREGRKYDHVDDPPAGRQIQLDFGQEKCEGGLTVHFLCLLLRHSRYLGVYAQDHRFDSAEACAAIYRFLCKIGGRAEEFVIDQDSVFVASEEYGEVVETQVFGDFLAEQQMGLWVCNKADPESKGAVENLVKFVKSSYFSARTITSMSQVRDTLPAWVERKNRRIHQATFKVPGDVFEQVEQAALRPLLSSVHEASPTNLVKVPIGSQPFMQYKSAKYSVPWDMCFHDAYYKAIGTKLHVYGEDRRHVCTHEISPVKGSFNRLDEHKKEEPSEWLDIAERLREKWNCTKFQHFINGFKKENPRHLAKQLRAVESFLDAEQPDRALVAGVMAQCCADWRYRFTQFKEVYELHKARAAAQGAGQAAPAATEVQKRDMERYRKAFEERCA